MLKEPSPLLNRLRNEISKMPVVDCHEHMAGPDSRFVPAYREPILALTSGYFTSDLWAAGASDEEIALIQSEEAATDEKWPVFSRLWAAAEHTAYARVTKLVLKESYGLQELTRESLDRVAGHLASRDRSFYVDVINNSGIKAIVSDALSPPDDEHVKYFGNPILQEYLEGTFRMPPTWHPVFPLPYFHEIRRREFIDFVGTTAGSDVTSLDDYEEAVFELIRRAKDLGVVALKDQSAYRRVIAYDLPARSDAERIFNKLLMDPRNRLAWPEAKPLDDHLFHQYMRFACQLELPVQIHTGHMAGIRNRVDKANAAHLAPVLELHSKVEFDLFHGNWPYLGDLLFLGKNYPNVKLDLCWVHIIDPLYAVELLRRAVVTVPHAKIHGFGGDYRDAPEFAAAHLVIAREAIATALADLVEWGWLEEEDAVRIAADWLYNNPNRFYRLGLPPFEP